MSNGWKIIAEATLMGLMAVIMNAHGGNLNPTNAPGQASTRTVQEIYDALGVGGTAVMWTGDTNAYYAGDDGNYRKGVPWPNPRFIVGEGSASNCVTDRMTGLMWLRNPPEAGTNWFAAIRWCENLDGADGRGGYTDWRLPNNTEFFSLLTYVGGRSTNLYPFIYERPPDYSYERFWSSTYSALGSNLNSKAWYFHVEDYDLLDDLSSTPRRMWPVRGGP